MGRKLSQALCCLLLSVLASACAVAPGSGTGTGTPDRLIIDTYDPVTVGPQYVAGDGGYPIPAGSTVEADLYSAADLVNPLATDDSGGLDRPETPLPEGFHAPAYSGFAYIDFPGPLAAGDYYVRVQLGSSGTQDYAIRVLGSVSTDYTTWIFGGPPGGTSNDADYTTASSIALNGKAERRLASGGTNWFKITLQ